MQKVLFHRSRDEGDIGALSVEDLVARIQEEMKSVVEINCRNQL